ncbi:MAG: hypothetical protein WC455_26670, partial [Dehalococcoidia bacterium]
MPIDPEELASQFAEEGRQAQALQGAFRGSVGVNPDEYVKAMALAAKNGATAPTVMRNQKHFQAQTEVDEIDPQSLQKISPKLAAWLVAHEDNVPVAKDDVKILQKVEGLARDRALKAEELRVSESNKQRGAGIYSGLGATILSRLGSVASTVSDTEAAMVRATVGRIAGTEASTQALQTIRGSNPVSSLFRGLDIVGKKLTGWALPHEYETENLVVRDPVTGEEFFNLRAANPATFQGQMNAAKIVAGELAPTAATIGLAIGTGGAGSVSAAPKVGRLLGLVKNIGKYAVSAPGLLEMARTVQGQFQNGVQFLMAKDPTLNQEDAEVKAAPGALLAGLLSGPTGAAMEGKIYNDLLNKATKAGAGNIVKRWGAKLLSLGVTGVKEGSQEVVQGFAEDLADWITVNPDKTLVQVAGNAIQNLIGGVAMGGGMHLAFPGGHGPDRPIGNIQELVDATKESKLLPRSPEKFREAVGNLLGDEKVLIEPEPFIEYFQSKGLDPYAMAEKVGVKNLDEALSSGNPLIMETADYLAHLAVEHHEGLAPDLRTSIGEWTPRMSEENATALEEAKTEMVKAQEALEVIEEPTLQEQIKADLVKKFDPLFEPSTARTYADAFSNILATLEIRSGQDLSKWREGLTVSRPMEGERGMSAEDVVVNRLKNTGPVSPELETLFQEDLAPAAESPTIQEGGTSGTLTKRETNTRGAVANSRTEAGQPGDVSEQPANQTTARERLLAERTKRRDFALSDPEGVRPSTVQADPGEVPNPHKAILQSSSTLDDIRAEKLAIPIDGLTPDGYKFRSDGNRIAVDGPNGEYVELVVHPHRALIVVDNVLVPEGRRGEGLGKRLYRRATQVIGNAYPEVRWVIGETASKEADAMRKSYPSTVTEGNTHITPIKEMMEGRSSKEAQGVGQTLYQNDRQRRARQAMGRTLSPSGQGAELNRRADEARMSEASFLAWEEEIKAIQLGDVHEGKQGFIQFGDNYQVHVGLLETANLSTLIHEIGGHFAFEIMRDLAGQEGTPQQIKDDYAKILEAVGAENGVVGKDQHETFARLTEAYFMEGKAPSEELRGTFARVKEWMKLIYRQLKNLGVRLSPEVRTIFDRMYATDEAIAQARESAQETRKLIAKPEYVGWDQATFDRYQKTIAKSQERAAVEVEQKFIAEAQRQHESWWKDEEGKIRGEVEIAVDSRKDFKDLKALQRGQLEDGTPMKLDRAQIVALIGEKETQAI